MSTVGAVTSVLLRAGERRATERAGGFQVEAPDARVVLVRWRAPRHQPHSAAGLAFVEEYARLLRDVGVSALVITDGGDPRVLVQPDRNMRRTGIAG